MIFSPPRGGQGPPYVKILGGWGGEGLSFTSVRATRTVKDNDLSKQHELPSHYCGLQRLQLDVCV